MSAPPGAPGMATPSGSTAKTLILIGLILGIIEAIYFLIAIGVVAALAVSVSPAALGFAVLWIVVGLIGIVILFFVYRFCYQPVRRGEYQRARRPTLLWAIISIVTINVIPGVLFLVAWIKLGDAVREQQAPPMGYVMPGQPMAAPMGAPMAAAPMAAPGAMPAAAAMAAPAQPAPICPTCGKPGTWIPQYGRYYCYTDSKYL